MKYTVGDTIIGIINNIRDNGVFVTLDSNNFGFMPKLLSLSYYDEDGNLTKNRGDKIKVIICKIDDKGILLSDIDSYKKEKERLDKQEERKKKQECVRNFASTYQRGQIFEVEVIKIGVLNVSIRLGDVEGVIAKEETNWNEINQLSDLLYEGEIINAVYLECDNNQLKFSLKYLNEKPYTDELYDLSLMELLKYAGHTENLFIGQAKRFGAFTFIENLYSIGKFQKGKLLVDPIYGYNLRALVLNSNFNIEENRFYKVELQLISKNKRIERNQLFQFAAINICEAENPYKNDVELTFEKNTSPATNIAAAHLLAEVGKNMYSSKDRMFFELIQNADDASAQKGVRVDVSSTGDYLLVRHNGNSFDKDDFEAITSAANGTKKANENKTGYKGIGFKSVFTDSELVFIKTGGYQFKFDKNDVRFSDFDLFYFNVNRLETTEQKQRFLQKFSSEKSKFRGIADIPWQLEPIWVEEFPSELGATFTKPNVSIALKLGENKIEGENGYQRSIDDIINNPKFMLFLRNTKRIDFNGKSVSKEIKDSIIILKNSFNSNRVELFERKDFEIEINNEIFANRNIDIRVKIDEKDEQTGKILEAKFVDLDNHELDNIPKKIAINNSTNISFAIPLFETNNGINPNKGRTDISLFAFLPTLVKDFKFPFYINANFILDPPRQRILGDNPWNFYLMQEIAVQLVNWCAELNKREDKNALNILVSDYFDESTADIKQLAEYFNSSYKLALESTSFILNQFGKLAKQDELVLDSTGLSGIVGEQIFCKIIETEKQLPSAKIDSSILSKKIFEQIEHIGIGDIVDNLIDNDNLNSWYVSTNKEKKDELHAWLIKNKDICREVIKLLPIFKFGKEWKSCNYINSNSDYIITTEHIIPIKEILSKLGYECSEELSDNNPLMEYIDIQNEKELFDDIVGKLSNCSLMPNEKLLLITTLAEFHNVGENSIANINLFCNQNGEQMPLCKMLEYKENTPDWLKSYVICEEESFSELTMFLIRKENEFSDVVWKHLDEIDISANELYDRYKWSDGKYTRGLIDKYKGSQNFQKILYIVEESDTITKKYYLDNIVSIRLSSEKSYKIDSFEYRVLQIALNVFEDQPSVFSSKIYFNEQCIKNFSIKDEVICDYSQSNGQKKVIISLAKLLPQYCSQSDSIEKIKSLFESKRGLDKFFDAKSKPINEVYEELNTLLKIPHAMYSPWKSVSGNAIQYMFSVYQRKKTWSKVLGLKIDLAQESEEFITEMMDFLFKNQIDIKTSPFTYHMHQYFDNMYFANEYILKEEKLLPAIEKWSDNDIKKDYLLRNGVRSAAHISIKFRILFIENKPIDFLEELSNENIFESLTFFATAENLERPFIGKEQFCILNNIKSRKKTLITTSFDIKNIEDKSKEWDSTEYVEWKKEHFPHIFLFDNQMSKNMYYNEFLLFKYNKEDYCYDKQNQKLFINRSKDIDDLLFEIAKDGKTDFDLTDYQILCRKGKIAISKTDLEQKNKIIKDLQDENTELKKLLKERGLSDNDILNGYNNSSKKVFNLSQSQIEYNKSVITRPGLTQEEQIIAHKEAEFVIKEKLERDGYDCSDWILNEDAEKNEYEKWHSRNQIEKLIKNPDGEPVNLVVKSAKGGYIYLSATDFEFLTTDSDNILMVWDGSQVHSVTGEQIFNKDSNVNLIFDTEYTPKHYYAALSKVFQFVKRTTFAVKNPKYSAYDEVKSFGMDSKIEGIQELFDDNDI